MTNDQLNQLAEKVATYALNEWEKCPDAGSNEWDANEMLGAGMEHYQIDSLPKAEADLVWHRAINYFYNPSLYQTSEHTGFDNGSE